MNMNYCVVAFAIVFAISMITWVFDGRKNFTGPKVEIDHEILTAEPASDEDLSPANTQPGKPAEMKSATLS
jgi:hypothetical protein